MLTSEPQWIALYTKPRAEKQVERVLKSAGYMSYLPVRHELHTWSDRKKWVDVPLIRSYIFVRIVKTQLSKVQEADGVAWAVRIGGKVPVIPDWQIQELKDFLAAEMKVHVLAIERLKKGKRVRVHSGPMEGNEGVLVSNCVEGNFAVEFSGLSMAMVVEMDQDLLEVIDDEKTDKRKKYTIR